MKILELNLEKNNYQILIGEKIINNAGLYIKQRIANPSKIFVIYDQNVKNYLETLLQTIEDNFSDIKINSIAINSGEESKSFSTLNWLLEEILSHQIDRNSLLIAFGGGVIGDLVGFTASILLRGINFIQIPTTLLAQVDSSVGGKTAINSKYGKNLIGSFYQPKLVISDINLLTSLSDRDFLSGYAEIVKYGLIRDKEFFDFLDSNIDKIKSRDKDLIEKMVIKSCEHKKDIVSQDEKEQNIRALLNLGHTFGHALEKDTNFDYNILTHGESVAIGINMAFHFSCFLGIIDKSQVNKVENHLKSVGLPVRPSDIKEKWDIEVMINNFYSDKKTKNGKLTFILNKEIGNAFVESNVNEEDIRKFLFKFLEKK